MKCTNCGEDEELLRVIGADRLCMGCVVGEVVRLRAVIRDAVGKLTNLHCKTKRDQSRLCMAFDALHVEMR